jgi:hypothetical protein
MRWIGTLGVKNDFVKPSVDSIVEFQRFLALLGLPHHDSS